MFRPVVALLLSICGLQAMAAAPVTLVHAGWILPVPGQAPLSEQTLVVQDGKVVALRPGYLPASEFPGSESRIIDLRDRYVIPGLMDMHVHLTFPETPADFSRRSEADLAMVAVENARTTLMAGFTTVRDLGASSAEAIVAVRDAIERGAIPGPRIYAAGQSISATAGHGDRRFTRTDIAALMLSQGVCDGADDCRRAVRSQYKVGAETIKVHATGGGADPNGRRESAPELSDDELGAVVAAAHNLNLRVAAHAHGTAGVNAALAAGVDSIEHGSWIDDRSIELLLSKGSYLVPTAYLQDWFLSRKGIPEAAHEARRRNVALIHPKLSSAMKKGVKIAMGTDAGIMPHGQNAREIMKYVELGLTPMQAIQTATTNSARLLRIDQDVGTLEAGKKADLIALAGNPLERIGAVEEVTFVMRAGVVHRQD